jgi:hypothetical protein
MNLKDLKQILKECEDLWSLYSCDSLYYCMLGLEKQIKELENESST